MSKDTTQTNSVYGLGQVATIGVDVQLTWTSAAYLVLVGVIIIVCFFTAKRLL